MSVLRPDATAGTFDIVGIDGGITNTNSQGTVEAVSCISLFHSDVALTDLCHQTLDIQYTVGVATNVPTTFVSVGNNNQDGDLGGFLDIINTLLAEPQPPLVLTTSFGFDETFFQANPDIAKYVFSRIA